MRDILRELQQINHRSHAMTAFEMASMIAVLIPFVH